jgi:hypothetical protein
MRIKNNNMKKILIAIIALGLIASSSKAQVIYSKPGSVSDYRDMIQIGVKLGANYTTVYDLKSDHFTTSPIFGAITGVFVAIPFGKMFGFQPEIHISQKGFNANGTFLGSSYEFKRRSTFIDVPLLLSIKPNKLLNITVGPQYSYLVKEKDVFTSEFLTLEQETELSNQDVRLNMFGFTGGIDFDFSHFVLSTRAGWDINDNNGEGTATSPRYKNMWFQSTLGFRLVNN